jgi:hypothetical protein
MRTPPSPLFPLIDEESHGPRKGNVPAEAAGAEAVLFVAQRWAKKCESSATMNTKPTMAPKNEAIGGGALGVTD